MPELTLLLECKRRLSQPHRTASPYPRPRSDHLFLQPSLPFPHQLHTLLTLQVPPQEQVSTHTREHRLDPRNRVSSRLQDLLRLNLVRYSRVLFGGIGVEEPISSGDGALVPEGAELRGLD